MAAREHALAEMRPADHVGCAQRIAPEDGTRAVWRGEIQRGEILRQQSGHHGRAGLGGQVGGEDRLQRGIRQPVTREEHRVILPHAQIERRESGIRPLVGRAGGIAQGEAGGVHAGACIMLAAFAGNSKSLPPRA